MSLPARDDVAPEYRFDLTRIFERPADWDAAAEALRERLGRLESRASEPLDSPEDLRTLLESVEECHRRKQRLGLYALLAANVNTESEAASERRRRFRDLESEFSPAIAAVRRRLRDTGDDRLDALVAESGDYRRYAESLREQAARVRSPDAEEAVAAHAEVRSAPTRIIEAVRNEDFDPPTVERPDGTTVELRYGNFRDELTHADRDYRRRVYEAYRREMDRFEHALSRAFAEKLGAAHTEAEMRGHDSIRDRDFRGTYPESGLEPTLPGEVHDAMLGAVRANLDPYHRAQEDRRERLGVETLRPWDLSGSVADASDPEIPYEEAKERILGALEPLGDDYVARTRSFFEERRIDVYPTQDKRTDIPAYCPSSAEDGAFVLANYRDDVWSMSVVCHELGHALNVSYHREGPTRYATCPSSVCEVPSLLHEILLAEHCIAEGGALADHARDRLVEFLGGNFYNAAMSSAFVHELATAAEDGDHLSAERIRESYADLLAEFRPVVAYDDRAGRNWLGWGTREPYCSFQYVLGATGALVVRDRLRDGSLSPADYREFLRNTGREGVLAQFERLGIDPTSPDPYERAAEAFGGYLDEL
ncbi:M3 family metallopeptidase [Halorussus salilacus]|uniref:M3 family oligoendopeptidase n=1 Tax=Halorussus salilacus TaxID=2953750 RepID=UPI00209D0126|nr:M3 family metallopeptidase [Halorussus salilacus]USZ67900.1 M3 family metallopeptidase [Halorussus salilacus]